MTSYRCDVITLETRVTTGKVGFLGLGSTAYKGIASSCMTLCACNMCSLVNLAYYSTANPTSFVSTCVCCLIEQSSCDYT